MVVSLVNTPLVSLSLSMPDSSSQPSFATVPNTFKSLRSTIFSPSTNLTDRNSGVNVARSLTLITLPNCAF